MELSEEAIKNGFRVEDGKVVKYTIDGDGNLVRKRRNWQSSIRSKSRQYIKDECEECGTNDNLHIHHINLISKGGNGDKDNCMTLCWDCHKLVHNVIKSKKGNLKEKVESLLVLEKGLWGEYRIIDCWDIKIKNKKKKNG